MQQVNQHPKALLIRTTRTIQALRYFCDLVDCLFSSAASAAVLLVFMVYRVGCPASRKCPGL